MGAVDDKSYIYSCSGQRTHPLIVKDFYRLGDDKDKP